MCNNENGFRNITFDTAEGLWRRVVMQASLRTRASVGASGNTRADGFRVAAGFRYQKWPDRARRPTFGGKNRRNHAPGIFPGGSQPALITSRLVHRRRVRKKKTIFFSFAKLTEASIVISRYRLRFHWPAFFFSSLRSLHPPLPLTNWPIISSILLRILHSPNSLGFYFFLYIFILHFICFLLSKRIIH